MPDRKEESLADPEVRELVAKKHEYGAELRKLQAQIAELNAELTRKGAAADHVMLW